MNTTHRQKSGIVMSTVLILISAFSQYTSASAPQADELTRGVGIYPGDPKADFSPTMRIDTTYRNLAFRRPAIHSSAWDYNLTAQLVTDGIIDTTLPDRFRVFTSQKGELARNERDHLFDRNFMTMVTVDLSLIHI